MLRMELARQEKYYALSTQLDFERIVKGPWLADHYPHGLQRPVGDLDLIVSKEDAVWNVAAQIMSTVGQSANLRLKGAAFGNKPFYMAALTWDGEDQLVDRFYAADIQTTPLFGDFQRVRPRSLPAGLGDVTINLLALLEEGFQRDFHFLDYLDYLILRPSIDWGEVSEIIGDMCLAPELLKIDEGSNDQALVDVVNPAPKSIQRLSINELKRRQDSQPLLGFDDRSYGCADLNEMFSTHCALGGVWSLIHIKELSCLPCTSSLELIQRVDSRSLVMVTPAGFFLAITGKTFGEDQYNEALHIAQNYLLSRPF